MSVIDQPNFLDRIPHAKGSDGILVQHKLRTAALSIIMKTHYGPRHRSALEALAQIAAECREPDWDGHNALPVESATIERARRIIASLPGAIPSPDIGAEPDGHVTLEWYSGPRWQISLSVAPNGIMHHAAMLGASRNYGQDYVESKLSGWILNMIREVTQP